MNKKEILFCGILLGICLILMFSQAEASFVYNNHSITKDYTGGEIIRGKFNLSFENQLASSLFTSNFPGNITLIDLILKNSAEQGFEEGTEYNCTIKNCGSDYGAKNEIPSSFICG